MKNQRNQVIALVVLIIGWAAYWHFYIKMPQLKVAQAAAAKATKSDSLLQIRFRKVRSEMDALYHYRINPAAFNAQSSPFRIPRGMEGPGDGGNAAADSALKALPSDSASNGPLPPDSAEKLLRSAVASMRIGGVVTLNGTTQLTVDGQLHKEGDEFAARVPISKGQVKPILIKIKLLSTSSVTLVLESEGGGAEIRVRLN
jgi:hypothetical protein